MDPNNQKYKDELNKLNAFINKPSQEQTEWNKNTNTQGQYNGPQQQMGGTGCVESCCQCLACNALLNCFCNSCGC